MHFSAKQELCNVQIVVASGIVSGGKIVVVGGTVLSNWACCCRPCWDLSAGSL